MSRKLYSITVSDKRFIPGLNRFGPITIPVSVSQSIYDSLLRLQYDIRLIREIDLDEEEAKKSLAKKEEDLTLEVVRDTPPAFKQEEINLDNIQLDNVEEDNFLEETSEINEEESSIEEATENLEVELQVLSDEEVEKLNVAELREYLGAFEEAFDEAQVKTVRNGTKRELISLAKSLNH